MWKLWEVNEIPMESHVTKKYNAFETSKDFKFWMKMLQQWSEICGWQWIIIDDDGMISHLGKYIYIESLTLQMKDPCNVFNI